MDRGKSGLAEAKSALNGMNDRQLGICTREVNTVMLCAIAKIDTQSRENLLALQQVTERFGMTVKKLYGHITLAAYVGEDDSAFIASCKEILSAYAPFSVYYEKVEVLGATSIIAATPRKENALLDIHNDIAAQWGESLDHWTGNDHWQPHTTLIYNPQIDLQVIAEEMRKEFIPFFAHVKRIEFSQAADIGYEIVDAIDLHQRLIPVFSPYVQEPVEKTGA